MEIDTREEALLNFYRVSELYGGLVLGHMVNRARDERLAAELTRHSAEEVRHSQMWAETITRVGARIHRVRRPYQSRLAEGLGKPASVLSVLAATQVFERRVYRHFLEHLRRPGTHPAVRETLERMLEEEKHHLSWVKQWLDEQAAAGRADVEELLRQYAHVESFVYQGFLAEYGWVEPALV